MPPVTPSPHRFLAGQKRQPSPSKEAKPPSTLRRQAFTERELTPQRATPAPNPGQFAATPQRAPPAPNPGQFAATPRFSFGRPGPTLHPRASSPPKPSLANALRVSARPVEDVEETRHEADDEDDEMLMLDDEQAQALPTTESTQQLHQDQNWTNDLPYSPKRRRIDAQGNTDSPAKSVFKLPTTPASHLNAGPHQFSRAGSVASTVGADDSTGIRRPAFLRSSIAPPEQTEPLPEAFSPHRRGEKFVPGGMAATMQQWVIETGQAAAHSRKGQGYLRGEDYVMRVKVDSASGTGLFLIQGRQEGGEVLKLLLVVDSKKTSVDVKSGTVVGVRAPTWEVELDGSMWTVGVDWKTLQQS